jgi:hypothetical protein
MKVPMCRRSSLCGCSEAYYPSQIFRIRPQPSIEFEIPNPGEHVLQFLEAVFETEVALPIWKHNRVNIGFREKVGRRFTMSSSPISVENPNIRRAERACWNFEVMPGLRIALRNEVLLLM